MTLKPGQTMIEMMIALAVIAVGLFSALNLVYSNLALVDRDTDETIAINLAREGVELAKEVRDSNWLAGQAFDVGLTRPGVPTDYTGTAVWNGDAGAVPSFDFTADAITDVNANIVFSSNGLFAQSGAVGTSTVFTRLLTFHPICDDAGALVIMNPPSDCGVLQKVGVRTESAIRWNRKGIVKNEVIYDDIYDWR